MTLLQARQMKGHDLPKGSGSRRSRFFDTSAVRRSLIMLLGIGIMGGWFCPYLDSKATAQQRSGLLEELFRTIAKSQLEREQRKRLEAERNSQAFPDSRRNVPPPSTRPPTSRPRINVPPLNNGNNTSNRPSIDPRIDPRNSNPRSGAGQGSDQRRPAPIPVDSETYRRLQDDLNRIVVSLRRNSTQNANLRALVPDAYRLSAEVGTLADYAARSQRGRLVEAIAPFDRDYRQFSFSLRSTPGVPSDIRTLTSQCDRLVNSMSRSYSIRPQWDRGRFDDIALVTAIQIQTILDDLEVISITENQRRTYSHDLRLLGRKIDVIRDHVPSMTYEEAAAEFTQFTAEMSQIGRSLHSLRSPHIERRLERLRELASETYALLWMPSPVQSSELISTARRLETNAHDLRQVLDRNVTRVLDDRSRNRIEALTRSLDLGSHKLVEQVERRAETEAARQLQAIDSSVGELIRLTRYLPGPHHAPLTAVRDDTAALESMMQVGSQSGLANHEHLLQIAATLEGGGEALREAVRRYDRYFRSNNYKNALRRDVDDFYREAKEFHEEIDERRDLDTIRRRVDRLLTAWQSLSRGIDSLDQSGLDSRSAATLRSYRDGMLPAVGEVAAAYSE